MNWQQFGWFDLIALTVLVVGVIRGRLRGMSAETLDLIQWLVIVGGGVMIYAPVGRLLSRTINIGLMLSYIMVYVAWALLIKTVVSLFKRSVGQKLFETEFFGHWEYYLGMTSGAIRYACMLIFFLALVNVRLVTNADLAREIETQKQDLGSNFFPTFGNFQRAIFQGSRSGDFAHHYLSFLLLAPTSPDSTAGHNSQWHFDQQWENVLKSK